MKYLTIDWLITDRLSLANRLTKKSKQAEKYNEKFYQRIYQKHCEQYVLNEKGNEFYRDPQEDLKGIDRLINSPDTSEEERERWRKFKEDFIYLNKERISQLEEKKKEIEITILQEKIKKPFLTKEQILFGIETYKQLDLSTKEGKQRLIDGFINAIYVYDDRITFTYNYKDGTETITLSELESTNSSDMKCVGAPTKEQMYTTSALFL